MSAIPSNAAATVVQAAPQKAAALPAAKKSRATRVDDEQLRPIVAEAIERGRLAGISAEQVALLESLEVEVRNLRGKVIGLATPDTIFIDVNAVGHGWFIDQTPSDDAEFTTPGNQGEARPLDLMA